MGLGGGGVLRRARCWLLLTFISHRFLPPVAADKYLTEVVCYRSATVARRILCIFWKRAWFGSVPVGENFP